MRLLSLLLALVSLTACGRWAPGYLVTSDGQTLSNTDENMRSITVASIVNQLDAQLGGHWRVEASIAELPIYTADDRSNDTGWMWPKATTTVTLIGDGTVAEPPLGEAAITDKVRDYMSRKVEHPTRNLSVVTSRVVDATRFAAKPPAGEKTVEKPAVPPTTGTRHYTVQTGDTWADLSLAFYGSAQHWRVLSDANQGGELNAGREIVIPPKP